MFDKFKKLYLHLIDRVRDLDPQVLLFLIVFYKMGWLKEFLNSSDINLHEYYNPFGIGSEHSDQTSLLLEAIDIFRDSFKQLDKNNVKEVYNILNELEYDLDSIFDLALGLIQDVLGAKSYEYIQPDELTQIMLSVANLKEDDQVYNPFSGLNSLGVKSECGAQFTCQEFNARTYGMGLLRIIAYGKEDTITALKSNSITDWQHSKFDRIISTPPFGMRLYNNSIPEIGDHRQLDTYLIERVINGLKPKGRAVITLSNNFLFNASNAAKNLRKVLIDEGVLEAIISLPGGIFKNTGIPSNVIVINKNNNSDPYFFDAKDLTIENEKKRQKVLNVDRILEIYFERKQTKYSKFISNEEICEENYELSLGKFFLGNFDGIKLKEIIQPIKKESIAKGQRLRLIKISDLSSSVDEGYTFSSDLADSTDNTRHLVLKEPALLVATTFEDLKPTYIDVADEAIAYINLINAYKVNTNLVDPVYLTHELRKDYIKEQVQALQVGSTVQRIRSKDLLSVRIKIPPLNQQYAIVKNLEEISLKLYQLRQERNAIVHGQKIEKFSEFGSIKHTTGTSRQSILDWSVNLNEFFTQNQVELTELNKEFKKLYELDINEALESITKSVEYITNVFEKGEKGLLLDNYLKEVIQLNKLNKFIQNLKQPGFKFHLDVRDLDEKALSERGIVANLELFQIFFDNLLTNANKYAFDSGNKESNEVVIELTEAEGYLRLEIKDNGMGFRRNFTKEKYIKRFSTTSSENGDGEGGYTVDQIAKYFGDKNWELLLNEDELYPVKFLFKFKVKSAE